MKAATQAKTIKTRPSALGMSDPVMEFLEILETKEFPITIKILREHMDDFSGRRRRLRGRRGMILGKGGANKLASSKLR